MRIICENVNAIDLRNTYVRNACHNRYQITTTYRSVPLRPCTHHTTHALHTPQDMAALWSQYSDQHAALENASMQLKLATEQKKQSVKRRIAALAQVWLMGGGKWAVGAGPGEVMGVS